MNCSRLPCRRTALEAPNPTPSDKRTCTHSTYALQQTYNSYGDIRRGLENARCPRTKSALPAQGQRRSRDARRRDAVTRHLWTAPGGAAAFAANSSCPLGWRVSEPSLTSPTNSGKVDSTGNMYLLAGLSQLTNKDSIMRTDYTCQHIFLHRDSPLRDEHVPNP